MDKSNLVLLIDSRELSGAQELMSTLRLMHKRNTVVCQLTGCDYVVSNRMGVERKIVSGKCNC
jgi:Fanconi anemia group M protein